MLKLGSKGPDVEQLQRLLNTSLTPSPHLVVDGDFGRNCRAAVIRFQKVKGLSSDGIAGPGTLSALKCQRRLRPQPLSAA